MPYAGEKVSFILMVRVEACSHWNWPHRLPSCNNVCMCAWYIYGIVTLLSCAIFVPTLFGSFCAIFALYLFCSSKVFCRCTDAQSLFGKPCFVPYLFLHYNLGHFVPYLLHIIFVHRNFFWWVHRCTSLLARSPAACPFPGYVCVCVHVCLYAWCAQILVWVNVRVYTLFLRIYTYALTSFDKSHGGLCDKFKHQ